MTFLVCMRVRGLDVRSGCTYWEDVSGGWRESQQSTQTHTTWAIGKRSSHVCRLCSKFLWREAVGSGLKVLGRLFIAEVFIAGYTTSVERNAAAHGRSTWKFGITDAEIPRNDCKTESRLEKIFEGKLCIGDGDQCTVGKRGACEIEAQIRAKNTSLAPELLFMPCSRAIASLRGVNTGRETTVHERMREKFVTG